MTRRLPFGPTFAFLALLALVALPGCATLNDVMALRSVTFEFAGVSDARLAGLPIGPGASYGSLGVADLARITAAAVAHQAPLEAVVHVRAVNPAANRVAATISGLDWKLFVDDRQVLTGGLAERVALRAGVDGDVPLAVRLDLYAMGAKGARDLFDLALAIAGQGTVAKPLRLEMVPTVETALGPIRYPAPVVISRAGR